MLRHHWPWHAARCYAASGAPRRRAVSLKLAQPHRRTWCPVRPLSTTFDAAASHNAATPAVGVDFGTTNSAVAYVDGRTPVILRDQDGRRTTPSVVSLLPGGSVLVGLPAARAAAANAANTYSSVKRVLGLQFHEAAAQDVLASASFDARPDDGGGIALLCPALGKALAPQGLAALIMRHLGSLAQARTGAGPPWPAVLAVPARFTDPQRQATLAAAEAAGLQVLRLINEPTAAALAYGFGCEEAGAAHGDRGRNEEEEAREELVLVFDLGGGTLDVSLLDVGGGVFDVLASSGDARLGGDDFDAEVARWMAELGGVPAPSAAAAAALLAVAEAAKVALSDDEAVAVQLPGGGAPLTLTRAVLEARCAPLLQRCAVPVRAVFEEARRDGGGAVAPSDLAAVLLVGGATRMPAVRTLVRQLTGREPLTGVDPDEVVALGCAVQAAALTGQLRRGEAILLDETPDSGDFVALLERMRATLDRGAAAGAAASGLRLRCRDPLASRRSTDGCRIVARPRRRCGIS